MTLQEIKDAVAADLIGVLSDVASKQSTYFGVHSKYFQLLFTHSADPIDGSVENADNLDTEIPSQDVTAIDLGITSFSKMYRMRVNKYDGPLGKGYRVMVSFSSSGKVYSKTVDPGPEGRSLDWRELKKIV